MTISKGLSDISLDAHGDDKAIGNDKTRKTLSLHAQDGARTITPALGGRVQLAASFLGDAEDDTVRPSQAEITERARQELLRRQHSANAEIDDLAAGIQSKGSLDKSSGAKIAAYMQHWHQQNGNSSGVSLDQVNKINAEFDQLAKPGGPHYRLTARATGNNLHLEMSDLSVRYQPPTDIDPKAFQTQQGRNNFTEQITAEYRKRSFKGSLDFNIAITPESSEAISGQAARVADSIKQTGKLRADIVDPAFDLAIKNRAPSDTSGKEITQTLVNSINAELSGSDYKMVALAGSAVTASPALAGYLREHPTAQGMFLTKNDKVVQEYAYDPGSGLQTAPETRRSADSLADPTADRINRFGAFTDPNAGVERRAQYNEALKRFESQSAAPAIVEAINAQLVAAHSRYRLRIEPADPRKAPIYQAMQISIIDGEANGRPTDFVQLPPVR